MTMLNWTATIRRGGGVTITLPELGKTLDIPHCSIQEMSQGLDRYKAGALIQVAFPTLTDDEREFLMTGIGPGEWDAIFSESDEEDFGLCAYCGEEEKAEDSEYCPGCLADLEAEEKAALECPLCGRESCSGYCQEFPR